MARTGRAFPSHVRWLRPTVAPALAVAARTTNPITANATALWKATGTGLKTLSVVPSVVGALLVLTTTDANNITSTAVSGGGCNASGSGLDGAWQRIAGPFSSASPASTEMWMGKVITAGSSTITITNTDTTNTIRLNCKEFNSGGGIGTAWAQDGAGGSITNATSTTVTFPTLTPTGINRLYVGFGFNGTGLTTGATPAGTTVELDPGTNPYLYNPSVANSAQTPTSQQSGSATSAMIGALITATNPTAQFMPFFM